MFARKYGTRRGAARLSAAVMPILATPLTPVGCTHTTLRQALAIDGLTALDVGVLERAAAQRFPCGTGIEVIERELPCSTAPTSHVPWYPLDMFFWEANDGTVAICSYQYFLFGIRTAYELQLEFDNDKLARLTVRDAGRAL